jgi:hypothetical protein
MSALRVIAAALAVGVVAGLLARWPLRWATPFLPATIRCESPAGSLWHGSCGTATVAGTPMGSFRWQLAGGPLLRGRVQARVASEQPGLSVESELRAGLGGSVEIRQLNADVSLDAPPVSRYTAGLRGRVRARLDSLSIADRRVVAVRGQLAADDLVQARDGNLPLGSYEVVFGGEPGASGATSPAGGPAGAAGPSGRVRDRGGPLEVDARLQLTAGPGYLLEGTVAPRAGASPVLIRQLAMLGPTDAQGRRSFAQEATF